MSRVSTLVLNTTFVAIQGRALGIEGPSGSGKSSLALALIDRGAMLIGDDGARLTQDNGRLIVHPSPETEGLLEVRGVGLVEMPVAPPTPLALILSIEPETVRLPEKAHTRTILSSEIPVLPFTPGNIAPAQRAGHALAKFGLNQPTDSGT